MASAMSPSLPRGVAYSWFTVRASDWRISIRKEMNQSDNDANTKAIDSLLNFETVKYFGNEEMESRRFDSSMERYESAATKTWTSLGWLNFGQGLIFGIGMTIVMILSALEVQKGNQTLGDFVFINAMLMQLSIPLNFIGFVYREIRQGLADIEQMFDLLAIDQEITDKPGAKTLKVGDARIRFDKVDFAYDEKRKILKGLDFEVPAGSTIAIVGPSGAGKSTISRLLFRFYDVTGGDHHRRAGHPRCDAGLAARGHRHGAAGHGAVQRHHPLQHRYGRPDASDAEVEEAAKLAQIHDFIMSLPDGYDSMVGERG
jgi:ABC-type transport system involved in Fe-S cluster assembly fused permease/ATPase subunit